MLEEHRSPWMTPELDVFRATVRRFFQTEVVPHSARWDRQQHVDRAVWRKAGAIGLPCASVPEAYGGWGGSFLHEAIIIEEQARAGDSAFGVVFANQGIPVLLHAATEAQKKQWIPRLASGESTFAFALTEPGAGSDAKAISTRARRDGEHYVISGAKTFISNGYNGDVVLLAARTADTEDPAKGVSLLMLDTRGLAGYRVGRILDKLGQKGQDTCELFLDGVRVPAANLLGGVENQGFKQLMNGLRTERATLGVMSVANAERAVRITTDYVKQRKAFGKTLFDLQNTRFKLAECWTLARVARVFIDHCIVLANEGRFDTATAAMCKWWCSEIQGRVIDECLQLHGGYGYMTEYPIARMWADARIQRIYGGATEIQKELIARAM